MLVTLTSNLIFAAEEVGQHQKPDCKGQIQSSRNQEDVINDSAGITQEEKTESIEK